MSVASGWQRSTSGGPPTRPLEFADTEDARWFLRSLQMDAMNVAILRSALREEGDVVDLGRLHDHEILDLAAARLVSGRFRLSEVRLSRAAVGGGNVAEESEEEGDSAPVGAVDEPTHWLEIELVDEEDGPVADESYRITFANGQVREGRTDATGLIRYPNLQEGGECEISFPGLDQDAWESI